MKPFDLILAWGNPSRGDDALGPLLVDAVTQAPMPDLECILDFQLQLEHALDLKGRRCVLFVDAARSESLEPGQAFRVGRIEPASGMAHTSHALSPQQVLAVYERIEKKAAPEAWLLAIAGEAWGLGEGLSKVAQHNLDQALAWLVAVQSGERGPIS